MIAEVRSTDVRALARALAAAGVSMPWMRSSLRTVSDGWAPRASQLRARSSSITIVEGSVCAL